MSRRDDALALQCKVELADWHDSGETGCTVTLRLSDADSLSMLKAAFANQSEGMRTHYLLHLLKMDESRQSIDPVRRRRLEEALKREPLSRNALTLSRDPDFWRYLEHIDLVAMDREIDEVHAKRYIYRTCTVASAHQLDRDTGAARLYRTLIIRPFLAWLASQ
ncbi:MAG: hypothetical protein ACE5LB_03315 [Acidiferrobacterales bacterium]